MVLLWIYYNYCILNLASWAIFLLMYVACYHPQIANVFEPSWPVTKKINFFNFEQRNCVTVAGHIQ